MPLKWNKEYHPRFKGKLSLSEKNIPIKVIKVILKGIHAYEGEKKSCLGMANHLKNVAVF